MKKSVLKTAITVAMTTILMTGCSIKNDDSLGEKVAKHTINSPLYVLAVGGVLVGATVNGVANVTGANDKASK